MSISVVKFLMDLTIILMYKISSNTQYVLDMVRSESDGGQRTDELNLAIAAIIECTQGCK